MDIPKIVGNKLVYTARGVKKTIAIEETVAYKKGFSHGLKEGVDKNPYTWDSYRYLYNCGYDAGVSEYCRREHPEDENA
jgi:hypothetical protein